MRNLLILVLVVFSFSAFADPLDDGKAAGHIKELENGFIVASATAPNSVQMTVTDINAKRRAAYERIAKKNNITVEQVGRESYRLRHPQR